jgi:ribosomal protein S14
LQTVRASAVPLSRRELLGIAAAVPVGVAAGTLAAGLGRVVVGAVAAVRPPAAGTSATRCARCGDPSHTMLDSSCPMERRVIRDAA